ncbi:hypothetical protein N9L68_07465 [bacterium]|nr:hypothetical protein [bacterium]
MADDVRPPRILWQGAAGATRGQSLAMSDSDDSCVTHDDIDRDRKQRPEPLVSRPSLRPRLIFVALGRLGPQARHVQVAIRAMNGAQSPGRR